MGNMDGLITGHTESKRTKAAGEEAAHCWRFMRRENVQLGVPILQWPGYAQDAGDIVLLVQFYASSTKPGQMLKIFLPAVLLAKVPSMPTVMSPRNAFSDRQHSEFQ